MAHSSVCMKFFYKGGIGVHIRKRTVFQVFCFDIDLTEESLFLLLCGSISCAEISEKHSDAVSGLGCLSGYERATL